jgi:Zn-dependent protease
MAPATMSERESDPRHAGRGSVSLGHLLGVPLEVHWTFALLLGLVALADWSAGPGAVASGLVWVVALFACVVAHEVAHCVVARQRGATVRRIVLLPIGGVSQLDAMPSDPHDELAVAIVGPATSLLLGVVLLAVALLVAGTVAWPPTVLSGSWLARLGWLNLLLAAFNMVPALPMDGGRVLRAVLARRRTHAEATVAAARVARWLGLAMVVLGLLCDVWLVFIGAFVLLGAAAESRAVREGPDTPRPGGPHRAPSRGDTKRRTDDEGTRTPIARGDRVDGRA